MTCVSDGISLEMPYKAHMSDVRDHLQLLIHVSWTVQPGTIQVGFILKSHRTLSSVGGSGD